MKNGNRTSCSLITGFLILVAGVALSSMQLHAEDEQQSATRAVRLTSVEGRVSLAQDSQVLADPALANTPLFEGTQVTTQDDGSAEIQFEDGSVARITPNSSLTLTVLRGAGNAAVTEIVLEGGLGYFEFQGNSQSGQMRIRFGDSVISATGLTVFRLNLDEPPGELAVFSGNAHLERGNSLSVDLHGGERVVLVGTDPSRFQLADSIEPDSWDNWNADRDAALASESAVQTDAANTVGESGNPAWNDLDASGNWYNVPDQGMVWSPYVAASGGWDPYGNGHWMWTPRFGYIWVSDYAWGYTPFQCGMWNFYDGFGWGWAPGMSGCNPWWSGGSYGINIGLAPGGYQHPSLPHQRPLPPHIFPRGGGGRTAPYPVIAVNRHSVGGAGSSIVRSKTIPVVIAGQSVLPMRPLHEQPAREPHDKATSAGGNPTYVNRQPTADASTPNALQPGYDARPGYVPSAGGGTVRGQHNTFAPTPTNNGGQHTYAPTHTYTPPPSGGGSTYHPPAGGGGSYSGGSSGGGSHYSAPAPAPAPAAAPSSHTHR
jgi:hypothetical protein